MEKIKFEKENVLNRKLKITFILVAIILLGTVSIKIYTNVLTQVMYPKKYVEYVEKYSYQYGVDPLLTYSIIKAESNFNEKAESTSGAKGLMQLMDNTVSELIENNEEILIGMEDEIFEPEKNIILGVKYYSYLYKKYNDNMLLALAAYNAGPGNVDKWISEGIIKSDGSDIENIPFKETNMYVRKIVKNYRVYQELYQ